MHYCYQFHLFFFLFLMWLWKTLSYIRGSYSIFIRHPRMKTDMQEPRTGPKEDLLRHEGVSHISPSILTLIIVSGSRCLGRRLTAGVSLLRTLDGPHQDLLAPSNGGGALGKQLGTQRGWLQIVPSGYIWCSRTLIKYHPFSDTNKKCRVNCKCKVCALSPRSKQPGSSHCQECKHTSSSAQGGSSVSVPEHLDCRVPKLDFLSYRKHL